MLKHNEARAEVGLKPMIWDEGLAKDADVYAKYLAKNSLFNHDPRLGELKQGENLWMGTRDAFGYAQMADGWISEKTMYIDGVLPNVSKDGNWTTVGHYTQIIWKSTTHVGCAVASDDRDDYLVCRYSPPGNYMGQHPIKN